MAEDKGKDLPRSPTCFIELDAERDNNAAVRALMMRLAFAAVWMTAGYALAELT